MLFTDVENAEKWSNYILQEKNHRERLVTEAPPNIDLYPVKSVKSLSHVYVCTAYIDNVRAKYFRTNCGEEKTW